MIIIYIILAVAAAVLLLGVIGERDRQKHQNVTIAFVVVVALIITLYAFR